METVLITIAGYALTVVFATTSVILANSLRHRRNELDAANSELIELRAIANSRLKELKTCRDAATLLKAKNATLGNLLEKAKSKPQGTHIRDGKKFVKII